MERRAGRVMRWALTEHVLGRYARRVYKAEGRQLTPHQARLELYERLEQAEPTERPERLAALARLDHREVATYLRWGRYVFVTLPRTFAEGRTDHQLVVTVQDDERPYGKRASKRARGRRREAKDKPAGRKGKQRLRALRRRDEDRTGGQRDF